MSGIFISRGMTVAIPAGGLRLAMADDGRVTPSVSIHVRFDVCPTWVSLALGHLKDAQGKRDARVCAWAGKDEQDKGTALEREFESSMQAIMAAAIALDAFYAMIRNHVEIPQSLVDQWRAKRTSRYAQIAEVIRRGFGLRTKGTSTLRTNLKAVYQLRDLAVHPSGRIDAPILHPELGVGVEWRFAYFRAQNAELAVTAATAILWELATVGKPTHEGIQRYMTALQPRLSELFPDGHPAFPEKEAQQTRCSEPGDGATVCNRPSVAPGH